MKNKEKVRCLQCDCLFYVIPCRKDKAKFCSNTCKHENKKGKPTWNFGKTYEECYGVERALEIKKKNSRPGVLNGMYGKSHTKEVKDVISKKKLGTTPYNKGKKFPGLLVNRNQWGQNNPSVKKVLRDEGISYEEYLSRYEERIAYSKLVRSITEQQPIHILENYDKRGPSGQIGNYHLDHIYPISKGFENKIPPELIGNILNLQFISWEENQSKFNKLFENYDYSIFH